MRQYQKTKLMNHNGEILLPQTTASMVSEEPDRRYVDNIEKTLLNRIATKEDILVTLIDKGAELSALATKERELLDLAEKMPSDAWGLMEDLNDLRRLTPIVNRLVEISAGTSPIINSTTSDNKYRMIVDDTNPEDIKVRFVLEGDFTIQPTFYQKGDSWKVSPVAGDVKLRVPVSFIAIQDKARTILTYEEAIKLPEVSKTIKEDIINGVKEHYVTGTDTTIPQIFVSFNVEDYVNSVFSSGIYGDAPIKDKISSFAIANLVQSGSELTEAKTQSYQNGNVVDPIRSSTRNENEYTIHRFSNDDWSSVNIPWLQDGKVASLVTFGDFNTKVAIAKPSLEIEIENPYKGLTLEAIREVDPVKGFDIRDWKIKQ